MKDIRFILLLSTQILPEIKDKTTSRGCIVYQKLLVLLLSSKLSLYRLLCGTDLVDTLKGSNIPLNSLLLTLGTNACLKAYLCLDPLDALLISDLKATALGGILYITLTLTDGESYTGVVAGK